MFNMHYNIIHIKALKQTTAVMHNSNEVDTLNENDWQACNFHSLAKGQRRWAYELWPCKKNSNSVLSADMGTFNKEQLCIKWCTLGIYSFPHV